MNTPSLPDLGQLKQDFDRDGYVVVRGLFSPEAVAEITAAFESIHASGEAERLHSDNIRDPKDPLSQWPRVVHPHRFNATARKHMLNEGVREVLTELFEDQPVAAQTMYYFKPPGARGQALHQDNLYLLVQPGTCIGAWTAMDICDEQNGCMLVVPGSHKGNLVCNQLDADTTEFFNPNHVPVPKGMKVVPVLMQPGDTLFFHGHIIHGSSANRHPTRFRRSFIGHYAAGDLEKISKFYLPLVEFDGTDREVAHANGGGACGEAWQGATH